MGLPSGYWLNPHWLGVGRVTIPCASSLDHGTQEEDFLKWEEQRLETAHGILHNRYQKAVQRITKTPALANSTRKDMVLPHSWRSCKALLSRQCLMIAESQIYHTVNMFDSGQICP